MEITQIVGFCSEDNIAYASSKLTNKKIAVYVSENVALHYCHPNLFRQQNVY
jgi:hypothetical protein